MAFSGVLILKGFDTNVSTYGLILVLIASVFSGFVYIIISKIGMDSYNAFAATQIRIIAAIVGFSIFFMFRREWNNVRKAIFNKKY